MAHLYTKYAGGRCAKHKRVSMSVRLCSLLVHYNTTSKCKLADAELLARTDKKKARKLMDTL